MGLAKFIGIEELSRDVDVGVFSPVYEPRVFWSDGAAEHAGPECFRFDTDWNWLMRAVKRFDEVDLTYTEEVISLTDSIEGCFWGDDVGKCYALCVKLLGLYEKQQGRDLPATTG